MPCHGKIIVIKRSGVDGTHFPLTATTCLFGRKSECDIRIQLPHVSKEHCKVEVKEKEVFVSNLSSVNPTQLNGHALKQTVRLKHGDIITIIDRSFRFESSQPQGRRRSAGLDSENFKLFVSNQSEDTNETVRIESITNKVQRKSEGNLTRATHTRRSLQASSSDAKGDHSPFGELYKMLKSEVEPRKKGTSQTPAKESSPKNANIKRNLQAEEVSPATSRRNSRSQSGDSATVQSQDIKVDRRSVSADPVREQSKSPLRGPRTSLTKQKQGSAVKANSPISSNKSVQNTQTHEEAAQSPRRRSGKQVSSSQEQEASVVSPERQSPRRSRSAGGIQVEGLVTSPASSSPRRSSGQSVPQPTGIENQENSPLPIQSPRGRRSGSKDQTMGSPSKPVETEENVNKPGQGLAKKSPRKRRSDELGLAEPPLKRKRVSFGGHLSPELFDKRLPPNSPLKKGATPARRSLSLNSPRTVIRKSFGLKQTVIREVFEASATRLSGSPLARSTTPTRRISAYAAAHNLLPGAVTALVSSPKRRSSAVNKSPSKSPSSNTITPVKQSPNKRSPSMALTLTPLRTSPSTRSQVISPSKTPDKKTPEKSELSGSAKRSSVSKLPDSAKKSPVKSLPPTPVGKTSVTISTTPSKRSPSSRSPMPVRQSPIKSEAFTPAKSFTPGKRSPGKSPSKTPAKLSTPGKRSPAKSPSTTPGKRSPGRPPSTTPAKKSPSTRSPSRSPIPVKQSPIKYEAATPAKSSTPGKRSPGRPLSATPAKKSPVKLSTSGKRSPGKSPSKTPAKLSTPSRRSPVKSPAKQSPKLPTPGKRSPGRPSSTPAKNSPAKLSTPGKRSPGRPSSTPAKNSPAKLSTPGRRSPAKSPSTTPTNKSKLSTPGKRSPGRPPSSTPAKNSPAKLSTPGKRSPAKSPSTTQAKKSKLATPGKRSPGKSPAKTPAKLSTPAKKSHKLPTPGKRSPGRPPSTPAKNSPAKLYTPGKRSPGKTPAKLSTTGKRSLSKSPSKKSQLATPGKRSPGKSPAKLSTPVKRSPGRPPAKKSPAKLTPSKRSPGKSPSTTPKKSPASKSPTSVKKSPAKRSPSTPYTKGRFSISRVDTPPKFVQDISASKTPKRSRKSMTSKKTPLRRSRKLEAFEAIRARRRSGASEANLYVVKSWADVVKIGVAKAQKKIDKPSKKTVVAKKITKKKPKPKTPKRVKDLASTGHAESPATILIGRAHTRRLTLTGYVPKVVRNEAVKVNLAHNESFTGIAELFSTPVNAKQRRSGRSDGSKAATPKSTVEMSVIQTPEESDEMMVSPLSSRPTTQRKQYGRDAVSRLLEVSLSPELRKVNSTVSENAEQEASKSAGKKRESFGLTGVKRIMKTPKQKGKPVADPHALRKLLKTPKETESAQTLTRRSAKLEVLGIAQLVNQKGGPVEDFSGVKRILKTPKQRGQPVADYIGMKRIMRTPRERGQPVEDMVGIKRLMRTPKVRGQLIEDIDLSRLMSTPVDSTQSAENTRPIEEIFGMKNLVKTPPKKSAAEQALTIDPRNDSEVLKSAGASSAKRGRPSKRLSLSAETDTAVNEVQKTMAVAESEIAQESGVQSISEVIKSAHKKGRLSKNLQAPPESEITKSSAILEATSPSLRGRPRTAPEVQKEPQASDGDVTSPVRRGRPRSTVLSPVADSVTLQADEGAISQIQSESSVSDVVMSASRRGRPRSAAAPKESVTEVTSPSRRGRPSSAATKESVTEVTSPSRRGTPRSAAAAPQESVTEVTSPSRRGTPKSAAAAPKESITEVTSPSRRGRPSATAAPQESVTEVTSPSRRGTPRSADAAPKESVTEVTSPSRRGRASGTLAKESLPAEEITSPTRGGRRSASLKAAEESHPESQEITSPTRRGRSSLTAEVTKELAPAVEITSPSRRGRHSTTSDVAKAPHLDCYDEITSPKHRGRPSAPEAPSESVPNELTSPSRRGRSSTTTGEAKDSLQAAPEKITSPTRRGRPSSTAEATKESDKTADLKMASPSSSKKSKSTPEKLKESESVSDVKVISPSRRGRSVEAAKESVPVANKVASPTRRVEVQITETIPKELDSATNEKVKNTRGRPQRAEDLSKESASVVAATLQSRRGRSIDPVEVPKVSTKEPVSEVVSSRRGRPKASKELPKEPAIVTEEAPTTRRGRAKIPADVPEKVTDVSQTRRGRPKTDLPEARVSSASEDLTSTRRGRPKAASVMKEPVPAESGDVTSPARRGRTKVVEEHKEPVPAANEASSPTRRGRPKTTDIPKVPLPAAGDVTSPTRRGTKLSEQPKEPVQAASDVTSPTRRGKAKAAALVKEPVPKEKSDVSSPVRRGRTKVAEEQKEPAPEASDATSPTRRGRAKLAEQPQEPVPAASDVASTRRGRPKTADIPQEPVPAEGDVTSPTRRGRTKLSEQPKESVPATSDVSVPTRRGRPKTKGIPEKTVPDSAAISPLRSGLLQNSEEIKESLPVTAEVAPPKRGGRSARSTEKKTEVSDDATIMAKTEKRSVPRQTAKNRKQNVEELPQAADVSQAVESNTTSVQPAPPRRGRGRKAVQNEPPTAAADVADPKPEETKLTARRRGQSKNLDETSKESDVPDHAKSPEAKSDKRSSKNQKAIQPVEEPTKNMRGRQSRTAQKVDAAETSISEVTKSTDSPQKSPAKGRSRARETSDVPVEGQEQVSKQRGRRKNQSANETPQVQTESRSTRGKRGLADSEQPQPVEIKEKTTRGKASGESVGEEKPSKAKSVQWHPLLATNENAKGTDEVEETATEAPSRGGRSKGRTKPDTSEPVSAKRSRRENLEDDKSVPPAISETNTASSKGKRGRKPAIPQEQVEEDKPSDKQSASETAKSLGKQALKPTRGRKAAASSKDLDSENNEVDTTVVPAPRGRRGGTAASIAPAESTNQSPAKEKKQKKAVLAKKSSIEAEEVAAKPARGVKRRNLATESNDNASANHADTESVPSVHGKRNARNTKAEKDQPTKESSVEKRMVSSPAKRRKTEAATSVTTTRGKSKQTPEHVEAAVVTKGRASTRSRK